MKPTVALIYMASGEGRRFGSNKLLAPLGNKLVYQYGLERLTAIGEKIDAPVHVVTAHQEIVAWCERRHIPIAINREAAEGMAASLRLGIQHSPEAMYYAFFPADQPLLQQKSIETFIQGFLQSPYRVGAMYNGSRVMSPAIFHESYKAKLLALQGDSGGRAIVKQQRALWTYEPRSWELIDVDTPGDLVRCIDIMKYNGACTEEGI